MGLGNGVLHQQRLGVKRAAPAGINSYFGTVFSTGQSVCPEPGPGRTAACRPIRSFSEVVRQVRIKDEGRRHAVVPSSSFWNFPHTSE